MKNYKKLKIKNQSWKQILIIGLFSISLFKQAIADDPMWLPIMLEQMDMSEMRAKGLKLTAKEIYNVNKSSIKDAVVLFGNGCTGEVISEKGLLITNHHCGYSYINGFSTIENNYLKNGFWAKSPNEELACKGLTVTFLVKMENVTKIILADVKPNMTEKERDKTIGIAIKLLKDKVTSTNNYEAVIKPMYNGNEYYLFVNQVFKDIRLVGTPPEAIGRFGGATDNWVWPRHTGDFCLFRIYANSNNEPAEYSSSNVPYIPKHSLPISLKGVKKDDFTMVMGYPGKTVEYITSFAVDNMVNVENTARIKCRNIRLSIMDEYMKTSDKIHLQYATKNTSIANSWKKWIGETSGVKRFNVVNNKIQSEQEFTNWVNADVDRKNKYGKLLNEFEKTYKQYNPIDLSYIFYSEAGFGIELLKYANGYYPLIMKVSVENPSPDDLKKLVDQYKIGAKGYFKNYYQPIDKKIFESLMNLYYSSIDKYKQPDIFREIETKFNNDFEKYANYIFENSMFASEQKLMDFLDKFDATKLDVIKEDQAYKIATSFNDFFDTNIKNGIDKFPKKLDSLNRIYITALREMNTSKQFFPDANLTMRVNFGKVDDCYPSDGLHYLHYTTLDGVIAKEDTTTGDLNVPEKLKSLYKNKDYGRYESNGTVPVCFIATNHTTGGNSGSPIINGNGELIGVNFDRNWEGTMSDINFEPKICRNIVLDIRYALFIIDKYAGAKNIIDEMKIIN